MEKFFQIMGRILFIALAFFLLVKHFEKPGYWNILSGFDLAIHEAGHLLLSWGSETLAILGGTLFQLFFPIVFLISFAKKKEFVGTMFSFIWIGENLFNIAYYIADARARVIPLLGDNIDSHDWWNLLGRFNLLAYDKDISQVVGTTGIACMIFAIALGMYSITTVIKAESKVTSV
jgi:hypothetical protein